MHGVSENLFPRRIKALEIPILARNAKQIDRQHEEPVQLLARLFALRSLPGQLPVERLVCRQELGLTPHEDGRQDRSRKIDKQEIQGGRSIFALQLQRGSHRHCFRTCVDDAPTDSRDWRKAGERTLAIDLHLLTPFLSREGPSGEGWSAKMYWFTLRVNFRRRGNHTVLVYDEVFARISLLDRVDLARQLSEAVGSDRYASHIS